MVSVNVCIVCACSSITPNVTHDRQQNSHLNNERKSKEKTRNVSPSNKKWERSVFMCKLLQHIAWQIVIAFILINLIDNVMLIAYSSMRRWMEESSILFLQTCSQIAVKSNTDIKNQYEATSQKAKLLRMNFRQYLKPIWCTLVKCWVLI